MIFSKWIPFRFRLVVYNYFIVERGCDSSEKKVYEEIKRTGKKGI
jgi:hypothetical protein